MGPKPTDERSDHDLFRTELVNLMCGGGHNLRMILRHLRVLCLALLAWLMFVTRNVIASAGPNTRAAAG